MQTYDGKSPKYFVTSKLGISPVASVPLIMEQFQHHLDFVGVESVPCCIFKKLILEPGTDFGLWACYVRQDNEDGTETILHWNEYEHINTAVYKTVADYLYQSKQGK